MKHQNKLLIFLLTLSFTLPANAQDRTDAAPAAAENESGEAVKQKKPGKSKTFVPPGHLMLSWGLGKKLKGFYDPLYVDDDKSDFVSSTVHDIGFEYYQPFRSAFLENEIDVDYLSAGINIQLSSRLAADPKTIEKVPPHTRKERIIEQPEEYLGSIGLFMGIENTSFAMHGGFTIGRNIEYEEERLRYYQRADGSVGTKAVDGRGLIARDMLLSPNFLLRFGDLRSLHFKFRVLRENYNRLFDHVNYAFILPVSNLLSFEIGNGFYPVMTFFVSPVFHVFDELDFFARISMVLNYYDDNLKKIVLGEAYVLNFGMSYKF